MTITDRFNFVNKAANKALDDMLIKTCEKILSNNAPQEQVSTNYLQSASDANGFVQGLTLNTTYANDPSVILGQLIDLIAAEDDKAKRRVIADAIKYIQMITKPLDLWPNYLEPCWPKFQSLPSDENWRFTVTS